MRVIGLAVILTLSLTLAPLATEAQPTEKVPRIGILVDGPPLPPEERGRSPLVQGLRDLGWVPEQNVRLEALYSEGQQERLAELATELVRRQVDVIWVNGPPAAVAAARATKTIPIVFWGVGFPVEYGLVASLARPGGNVTGFAFSAGPEVFSKLLELLKAIAPRTVRVAMIYGTGSNDVSGRLVSISRPVLEPAARQLAMQLQGFPVRDREELSRAFTSILDWRAHAIYAYGDPLTWVEHKRIVDFANSNRLAGAFSMKAFALAGGLLSYGPDSAEEHRRSALYVNRILRGALPADLPVQQPTKFELVINRKTAKALGLTIPQKLLLRADQVIQ
jgi:ABC-type uncharacterized transport system substrate-binding protein